MFLLRVGRRAGQGRAVARPREPSCLDAAEHGARIVAGASKMDCFVAALLAMTDWGGGWRVGWGLVGSGLRLLSFGGWDGFE